MLLHIRTDPGWRDSEQRCQLDGPMQQVQFPTQIYTGFWLKFRCKSTVHADLQHKRHLRKATEYQWIGSVDPDGGEEQFDVS